MEIRKILCPTDFSPAADAALEMAADLARRYGATVTLLHVYQAPGYALPEGVVVAGPDVMRSIQERVDGSLAEARERAAALGLAGAEVASTIGNAHVEICRAAEEQGFDLIVIGTHGRTGIKHALLGSVAERVVRHAAVPVVTVRKRAA